MSAVGSHVKSVAKALTWRATAGVDTMVVGWFITGSIHAAIGIVGAEIFTKSFLYYLHERAWHLDLTKVLSLVSLSVPMIGLEGVCLMEEEDVL